jgi:tetratricopeptide (TPR) repeat protein
MKIGGFMKLFVPFLILMLCITPAIAQEKAEVAKANVQKGAYAQAVDAIGEAGSPDEHYWLGRAQLELKQYDAAEANFMRMLEMNEANSSAYDGLAHLANARKDYAKALEYGAKAIELDSGDAEAYHALGVAYAYRQDFRNSQANLEKAVELDPENAYAHYQLGLIHYRLKRFDQTVIHFERFLQLMPSAPEAAQVRSILRTVRG